MQHITLDTSRIVDWPSFHAEFKALFGFPEDYREDMPSWINCMMFLDDPEIGMSKIHVTKGGRLLLHITGTETFRKRCPEQFDALISGCATVNQRYIEDGVEAVICLVFL